MNFSDESLTIQPLVSIITPAYNESAIIEANLERLCLYMAGLEKLYRWELIVVNDGSTDNTGELADKFSEIHPQVKVHHHPANRNLGGALQTGFRLAQGDYIVVMDIDLSYSEDHIERMLAKMRETDADIVVASPYMEGGKNTAVPFFRLFLSRGANWIMRLMSPIPIHTFTGMVRAYKGTFLRSLNLKSVTYSINPEIINKGLILRARIEEIPGHLDWSRQRKLGQSRVSGIRISNGIVAGLMSGFIFRPYMFFMSIGIGLLIVALYIIAWIFVHTFSMLPEIAQDAGNFENRFGIAVGMVFQERPYSFMVGGIALMVALQFLSIGFLSLQNKRYFDELFHISTTILKNQRQETGNEKSKLRE
jgi:glycosyltransferase involved in cell wall biosynthesis